MHNSQYSLPLNLLDAHKHGSLERFEVGGAIKCKDLAL